MPQTLNPLIARSMFEYFFGTYGDNRANQAMNEVSSYFQNTPGAQDTFNSSAQPLRNMLMGQLNNGIPELNQMKQQAFNKIKNSTARNIRDIRENVDPMMLKTMGQTAFNDVYKNEEDSVSDSEMGFNQLQLQYKENAISKLLGIAETEANAMNQDRNYQVQLGQMMEGARQYNSQADHANDFNWGSAIGGLLGGLGSIFG